MSYHFGFVPSAKLSALIEECIRIAESGNTQTPLYTYRDEVTLTLADEIIDNVLMTLVKEMDAAKRRETAEKMVNLIKSTLQSLMKQVLGKSSNEETLKSLPFLQKLTHLDHEGVTRVGVAIDSNITANTKQVFTKLINENQDSDTIRKELVGAFKSLSEQITHGVLGDFIKTLPIGMFKRTASDIAIGAIIKALGLGASQIMPSLSHEDLKGMVKHFDQFIYPTKP